jgi:rhodanese-related sulfurtransferase/glyoxylase-like metal-dependent hydrolase (beta-lactamase superfamily II)
MVFERFYLDCLSHASYLVADGGEAAVVDPRRDVDEYLEAAARLGVTIRHVILTHLHADFVAGHVELAARTGATIHVGPGSGAHFPHEVATDGRELRLGGVTLRFLHTPGHTPESVCVLVDDGRGGPARLLTGDTLFAGDVGRPDLVASRGKTAEEMAGLLHESLARLAALPDATEVHPAHGAGSACGRAIAADAFTTIGLQRAVNPALRPMSRDRFIAEVIRDLPPAPGYFAHDAETNRRGAPSLAALPPARALPPEELAASDATVLDVRDAAAFAAGHVPGAVNLALGGRFAPWSGALLPPDGAFVVVAEDDARAAEARTRLARIGYERVLGWLAGGMAAWLAAGRPVERLEQTGVTELRRLVAGGLPVIDVRARAEYAAGHIPGARNVPLDELGGARLDPTREYAVVCAGGYRSSAACSLLRRRGFRALRNVSGGTSAWVEAGYPLARG